ncbi:MAG: homoserine dehydrogenase [Oscillatoriales cyanobacterium SM2_2_1]|nr:homoserine dehydrogenase [Oscillatoriales cyanobacterium SM2_2_1]
MAKTYRIGLLGLGTVGAGVAGILGDPMARHPLFGCVELYRVGVRSLEKKRAIVMDERLMTTDLEALVADPTVDVIVEVMGGLEPARTLILGAIAQGKHIVTANKALLARHGVEIFQAAQERGVYVMLEAAVCGGIPVIQSLKQSLGANRIVGLMGIVNGTTNYILSRMTREGAEFGTVLLAAQEMGYAEADPTADVDGYDAADKMAILASLAFGEQVALEAVYREGIRGVTRADIAYAAELGFGIKLLGIAQRQGSALRVRVHPTLVPHCHPLAAVQGVTNAVQIVGDPIGEVVFSGPGAGGGATASAVVADVLNVVAALEVAPQRVNPLMEFPYSKVAIVAPMSETVTAFYVRLVAADRPGVIGEIGVTFGRHGVSLEAIIQKNILPNGEAEIVAITQQVQEAAMQAALADLRQVQSLGAIASVFRLL